MEAPKDKYYVKALANGLTVLSSFDYTHQEMSVQEISRLTGINRVSVHRAVHTLAQEGFLQKRDNSAKYSLTSKIFIIGNSYASSLSVMAKARPYLERIARNYGVTTHLVIENQLDAIFIDKADPPDTVWLYSSVGRRVPLYCTAAGKVLLSKYDNERIAGSYSGVGLKKITVNTVDSIGRLLAEIDRVRAEGHAINNEELEIGQKCVAAPIYDHESSLVAAISASMNLYKLEQIDLQGLICAVTEGAASISGELGCPGRAKLPAAR
jgi:DNA-binding IclR family transcriptional regulator